VAWDEEEDTRTYKVVVNHEEQYSIWPADRDTPLGWRDVGKSGPKADCLAYIEDVWTDMRPLSLRRQMEELARHPPQAPAAAPTEAGEPPLISRLSQGSHPVAASLRPDKSAQALKEAIERGYVHILFTGTRGGTELGVGLDAAACDLSRADFANRSGTVHLEGGLTLDYTLVRCIADIDLTTLDGHGHLQIVAQPAPPPRG
jgi:uncharacterized protein YbdZ (MbtH family)